ncbi:MAG: hypothetical protein CL582_04385 [Alteromonadaceae bacterium]|jgi:hypothetical protein|nr:hypothetical protein [Alteromonadaceae bacterium]MEA3381400.1 hypothetical protein [Pseudomonadota bacterium]|tara:strand:+ start:742 stop:1089 length:348 start_codon:yes stop_codon:yes gene_type:complete
MRDIDSHPMSESVEKLIKVGAQSMISNIEEKKEYRDGVAQLMENYNRIENKGVLLVQPYYHFCCQVYVTGGKKGLYEVLKECPLPSITTPLFKMRFINEFYTLNYEKFLSSDRSA